MCGAMKNEDTCVVIMLWERWKILKLKKKNTTH